MIFLPIVVRELRVAARRKRTYAARFGAIFAAIAFGSYLLLVSQAFVGRAQGAMMFTSLAGLGFLICLSLAANTVDCISKEEKREGTLGFLFLTDLKGHDITLGKLFSNSLISFYSLLGILPVVAVSLLFGGVTVTEFWAAALGLLNVFFFSQATGIFVSAFSRKRNPRLRRRNDSPGLHNWILFIVSRIELLAFQPSGFPTRMPQSFLLYSLGLHDGRESGRAICQPVWTLLGFVTIHSSQCVAVPGRRQLVGSPKLGGKSA